MNELSTERSQTRFNWTRSVGREEEDKTEENTSVRTQRGEEQLVGEGLPEEESRMPESSEDLDALPGSEEATEGE